MRLWWTKVPVIPHTIRFPNETEAPDLQINVGDSITVAGHCTIFCAADRTIEIYFPPLNDKQRMDRLDRHLMDEYGIQVHNNVT